MANIQLPLDLVEKIYCFVSDPEEYDYLQEEIYQKLTEKKQAVQKRMCFTEYKKSKPNSDDREFYRKQYLQRSGYTQNFCTNEEVPNEDF